MRQSLYLARMPGQRVVKIRQRFDGARLEDVGGTLAEQLSALDGVIHARSRIAIAAGSRGIDNLAALVRHLGAYLKARGADPFVIPAMGSHGGATAQGQADILKLYGVSDAAVGMPVRSSMDVVELPRGELAFPI